MRAVQSSEVKAKLPQLLDEVERGETIVVTRHGKPVAHLTPVPNGDDRESVRQAIEGLRELRRNAKPWPLKEILKARHEGHNR